ncbi:MAG: hypothetical protein IJC07_05865 [Clostridia bacterium]|nr:hypothetical protein [Clostridia bacterium]
MKNFSVKKLILSLITFACSLMILLALCYRVSGIVVKGMDMEELIGPFAKETRASGFNMLAFGFAEAYKEFLIMPGLMTESFVSTFGVLFGVLSVCTLLISVLYMTLSVVFFFIGDERKVRIVLINTLIEGAVALVCYLVLAIIFNASVNNYLEVLIAEEFAPEFAELIKLKTNLYVPLILHVIFAVGGIICIKVIPSAKKDGGVKSKRLSADAVVKAEKALVQCFVEYKALLDSDVISATDFMEKKAKLLKFSNEKLRQLSGGGDYLTLVTAETEIVELLKLYKKLRDEQVLSDMDYIEKKVALLDCVIK